MDYKTLLKKYTDEYNKYINLGLSNEDASFLIEKHIKNEINTKTVTIEDILNMFEEKQDVKDTKKNIPSNDKETNTKEQNKKYYKEVISNTPNHKEFRLIFPNGYYYEYKFIM